RGGRTSAPPARALRCLPLPRRPVEPRVAASVPGRRSHADRRRSERDPGACRPADHRDFSHQPAEWMMGAGIVERFTELEAGVKRAAEAIGRLREENAQLRREMRRLGDERREDWKSRQLKYMHQ